MTAPRRVVVTGIGVVSSIGTGVEEFTAGLRAGRSGVGELTSFDTTGYPRTNACPVEDFVPEDWISRLPVDELSHSVRMAVAAARMAVDDAGLTSLDTRCHIAIGTADGGNDELDVVAAQEISRGLDGVDPGVAQRAAAWHAPVAIARELEIADAEALTVATACAAGNYAVGDGIDAIRCGDAEIALCGGADAISRKTFTVFGRLGAIAPDVCRPFDEDRQGILNGEGAGVLVLESLDSALARGARIYAELLGYALNCDAGHIVAPDQDSVERCMRLALDSVGLEPVEVDLVCAHGTGTKLNDVTESEAIRRVYGDHLTPTVSIKSMIGHTMGAAGALGVIASCLAIRHGFMPPTTNHRTTDPECAPIDCVPNEAVAADVGVVQNNALAFGGNNAVVVLARLEDR